MELQKFLNILHKRLLLILGIPFLASVIAAVVSMFIIDPIYEASSTLYIIDEKSVSEELVTYDEILANQSMVKDYRELIRSKSITKAALEALEIKDITPTDLSNRITVASKNDTRVLEIKVEDFDPVRAKELTNKICQVFIKKSTELMNLNNIRVVDTAEIPIDPIKPKPLVNIALAFLMSLFTTLGIFTLLELISETIKTSEDIENHLGLNILGTIPTFNLNKKEGYEYSEIKYVINYDLNETVEEAYNVLRANIHFCELNKKIKTIAFTSYNPGEGKSTTSINVSISMAKAGMNILYVDADLRKPMELKHLKSSNINGLTNYLMGQVNHKELINRTNINGFSFITCGIKPSNIGQLIASDRFKTFLREVEQQFDMIIIDMPPLGCVIDSALMSAQTDGTIIVIESNAVRCKNATMMKEQLQKANAKILGTVLNKISKTDYKNYYGRYDYYGDKEKTIKTWFHKMIGKRGRL